MAGRGEYEQKRITGKESWLNPRRTENAAASMADGSHKTAQDGASDSEVLLNF